MMIYLVYSNIIYDRAFNESFHEHLESIYYNAAIAITGAIRGTSLEKLFQELGLEILKSRLGLEDYICFILHNNTS